MSIIKGLQARLAPRWDPAAWPSAPLDLPRPGACVTQEEREALGVSANVIAARASGKLVDLAEYRLRRRRRNERGPAA